MTADVDHAPHLRRHLIEFIDDATTAEVQDLLRGLDFDPRDDQPLGADACTAYLFVLRDVRGELAYRMARLNFFLAGCPTARDNPDTLEPPARSGTQAHA